jgi:hypothetical protein
VKVKKVLRHFRPRLTLVVWLLWFLFSARQIAAWLPQVMVRGQVKVSFTEYVGIWLFLPFALKTTVGTLRRCREMPESAFECKLILGLLWAVTYFFWSVQVMLAILLTGPFAE